jgi:membrane-associated phospholipid phosphatase
LLLVRVLKDPQLLLMFLACYAVLTFSRFISITSLPLEPPPYLIPLADPLTNAFYGEKGYITKDLFFSGHTSTIFLISLCLKRPIDKYVILFVSIAIGFLCVIQHVHYTLDVVCAFPFTYLDWRIGKWLLERK